MEHSVVLQGTDIEMQHTQEDIHCFNCHMTQICMHVC